MANVMDFGAAGDGERDDADAVQHALEQGDGVLQFRSGAYRLGRTIEVELARHGWLGIEGSTGTARLVMVAPGPALRIVGTHEGTAVPASVLPPVWQRERLPLVSSLEIVGEHPEADGI